jgi:hypothetical protein
MTRPLPLACHPDTPCAALRGIVALARRDGDARLLLEYVLEGDLAALRVPAPATPRRAQELWRHTCLEAFVGTDGGDSYAEINLSPSGEWAAWSFDSYRGGRRDIAMREPRLDILAGTRSLQLRAELDLASLPWLAAADTWRVGLAAVVESGDGAISYWALAHPTGKPDFHAIVGRRCVFTRPPAG